MQYPFSRGDLVSIGDCEAIRAAYLRVHVCMEMNGGRCEQACKVGSYNRWICGGVSHRQCGCLCLAAEHTGCICTGFGRDVCRWRPFALYRRIHRPCIYPNGAGSLLFAQEIPDSIVFRYRKQAHTGCFASRAVIEIGTDTVGTCAMQRF